MGLCGSAFRGLSWLERLLVLVLYSCDIRGLLGELVGSNFVFKSLALSCIQWLWTWNAPVLVALLCPFPDISSIWWSLIPSEELLCAPGASFHSERIWPSPGVPFISLLKRSRCRRTVVYPFGSFLYYLCNPSFEKALLLWVMNCEQTCS